MLAITLVSPDPAALAEAAAAVRAVLTPSSETRLGEGALDLLADLPPVETHQAVKAAVGDRPVDFAVQSDWNRRKRLLIADMDSTIINVECLDELADNEPGVLHRVVGLFAARGYNIESLTVAETDRKAHTSRITVVTRGTRHVLDQIEAQLNKVVNVRRVHDVTRDPNGVERELALVKVRGQGVDRVEALRIAEIFRAKPVDTTLESFVFEISGAPSKIDKFLDLMRPLGLVELSRTGVLSIERGVEGM